MPQLTLEQLGQKVKAKYPEYASVPDAELAQRVIAKHPEYKDYVASTTPVVRPGENQFSAEPSLFSVAGIKKKLYETADRVTNELPAIGGIAGGAIGLEGGPLGAIGGAGIGGMGGEAARRLARGAIFGEESANTSDVAKGISSEGAKQASYEAGGQVGAKTAKVLATKLAPRIAEAAVAPGKRLLKSVPEEVNIGETILSQTKGNNPKTIAAELKPRIVADREAKVEALRQAKKDGVVIPVAAPQDMSKLELEKALKENAPDYIRGAEDVKTQLSYYMGERGKPIPIVDVSGKPTGQYLKLPDSVDPEQFDALRQGVDRTIGSFNPETAGALDPLRKQIRGTMSRSLHEAVPETAALDARMTQMIPAHEAAWNTSFNPGITKNAFERFARPTGAAALTIAGSAAGYKSEGAPGAVAGGVAGLGIPLLLTSPTGMMFSARMLNGKLVAQLVKGGRIAAPLIESQLTKDSAVSNRAKPVKKADE